ncbi:MAG: DUF6531 domain-containing protein [Waddliaceae bacterium]
MKAGKIKRACFFFCLLLPQAIFSLDSTPISKSVLDIEEYASLVDFEGMPDTVIDDCVNVLTGNYFEVVDDFVGAGPSPIAISRYFDSGSDVFSELSDLWDLNITSRLKTKTDGGNLYVNVFDRGVHLPFWGSKKSAELKISPKVIGAGVVNICSPYVSGKNHLLNKRIHILRDKKNTRYLLKSPGGESLLFTKEKKDSQYLLRTLCRSNGCQLSYIYDKNHVKRIESRNSKGQLSQAIGITKGNNRVTIAGDDGREITYTLSRMKSHHRGSSNSHRYCLTEVKSNFSPTVKYEYKKRGKHKRDQLIRKELPDNRYKNIVYYKSDKKKGKVKYLYSPVGVDSKPILTH